LGVDQVEVGDDATAHADAARSKLYDELVAAIDATA
jgi:hypothetical protein